MNRDTFLENLKNFKTEVLDKEHHNINGYYNILDYGVKNDGSTDNTEALNNFFSRPDIWGATVFFPQGTYNISNTIVINRGVNIIGVTQNRQINSNPNDISPQSVINYVGDKTNISLFTRPDDSYVSVCFKGVTFVGNSFDVKETGLIATSGSPAHYFEDEVLIEGISCLNFSNEGIFDVQNCCFIGFSDYAINLMQHKKVSDCGFFKCNIGIDLIHTDSLLEYLWFCKCSIGIRLSSVLNAYCLVGIYDSWFDQISNYAIYSDVSTTTLNIVGGWFDMIDYSAIYAPNGSCNNWRVDARMSRCGMYYAGTEKENVPKNERHKACCIFSRILSDSVISITPQRRLIKETTQYTGCYCPSAYFGTDSGWKNDTITVNGSSDDNSMNYLIMGGLNSSTVLRGDEPTKCNNVWNYTINGIQLRTSAPTTSQKAVNGGDMAFDTKNKNLYIANSNNAGDWTLLNGRDYAPVEGSDNYVTSGALYDIFKVINERISALEG